MTLTRRTFLGTTGVAAAAAVLGEGRLRAARADRSINFAGWVFKPDTVKDYVDYFNKKHGGQVKYDAVPWATYCLKCQELADLFVGCLREVAIPESDGTERFRGERTDDLVGQLAKVPAGPRRAHRHGHDDACGMQSPNGEHRRPHRRPGRSGPDDRRRLTSPSRNQESSSCHLWRS